MIAYIVILQADLFLAKLALESLADRFDLTGVSLVDHLDSAVEKVARVPQDGKDLVVITGDVVGYMDMETGMVTVGGKNADDVAMAVKAVRPDAKVFIFSTSDEERRFVNGRIPKTVDDLRNFISKYKSVSLIR